LEVFGRHTGYGTAGVSINPYIRWNTGGPCRLRFSVKGLAAGTSLAVELKARDARSDAEYRWSYFVCEIGEEGLRRTRAATAEWNGGPLAYFGELGCSPTSFRQWLPGLQCSPWTWRTNLWMDFEVNLRDVFSVAGAPARPSEQDLYQLRFLTPLAPRPEWPGYRIDGVKMSGEGIRSLPLE
jgi:hypothetical protein